MSRIPPDAPSDDARVQRLHEAVRDLADRQEDLRRQLAALVEIVETLADRSADDAAPSAPRQVSLPPSHRFGPPTTRPLPSRLRVAIKHRLLGPVIARAKALWRASRRIAPPTWSRTDTPPLELVVGDDAGQVRRWRSGPQLPVGVEALALHVMAVEGLGALRLLAPKIATGDARRDTLDVLWVRGALVDEPTTGAPTHLDLDAMPRDRPVAKTVHLFGDAEPTEVPPLPGAESLVSVGPWAFHPKARRPPEATLALGGLAVEPGPPTTAIVLTHPLTGGLDRWIGRMIRESLTTRPVFVAQMTVEGSAPAHPILDLAALGATVWPFADLVSAELRDAVLRQLLHHHRVDHLIHVGTGRGIFDTGDAGLREMLGTIRVVDLPLAHFPASTVVARPADWVDVTLTTDDASSSGSSAIRLPADPVGSPRPDRSGSVEARQRLGLDLGADDRLVVWQGDLVPEERPEDAVALADRLRDEPIHVLLVGRGPLAGTVDDLARFLKPPRLRRLPSAEPIDLLAAADLVVSTAERLPFPWWPQAARAAGLPVVEAAGTVDTLADRVRSTLAEPSEDSTGATPDEPDDAAWLPHVLPGHSDP
ncbi:MAG: hypothetical protein AAGE94_13800 [Acidobacteriota bacterium]